MSSSMLAGERRWASARRGGMTVLGKVAVPKPINLPSQRLENHGLDPNVEIVPKGSLSWGSRSSSASNPWGTSGVSPNADGTVSPSHLSGRPSSSGGSGTRPSTAGSDRIHEVGGSAWGPNSRPSSASGPLTSNQASQASSRPRSAETRPGSSQLSRFAEPVPDSSVAWGSTGTVEKLVLNSKSDNFSLSSGDFPTLGKNPEPEDNHSHDRPSSASGRVASPKERAQTDAKGGTIDTWTRDGAQHVEDGVHPNPEKWHGDHPQYLNPNMPPQHFDAWRGPPMNPPAGVWYRGPPGGPPYPPVAHGGFPIEPFPYYRPQIPPALANPQPVPPRGPGPRGHHPKNGDFYRPQMPDAFMRPGMPMRPGFYPGPVPYDGYYGPPMGYNPNEREIPFMGMPGGPPIYNMYPPQNSSEPGDIQPRPGGRGAGGKRLVTEHADLGHSDDTRGPYKVLKKRPNEWGLEEEENSEPTASAAALHLEKGEQPRKASAKNEWGSDNRTDDEFYSGRAMHGENHSSASGLGHQGHSSDSAKLKSPRDKSKAVDGSWGKKSEVASAFVEVPKVLPAASKDTALIQKIEILNAKVRAFDGREDVVPSSVGEEQMNRVQLVNTKTNNHSMNEAGGTPGDSISSPSELGGSTEETTSQATADTVPAISRRAHAGVHGRMDHQHKGRLNNHDSDGWRKKTPSLVSESSAAVAAVNHATVEAAEKSEIRPTGKKEEESSTPVFEPIDGQAQRAKMRELAKQRAIQLQKEEEERIREQKAKALAKLEELNRRTLAGDSSAQKLEMPVTSSAAQKDSEESKKHPGVAMDADKHVTEQLEKALASCATQLDPEESQKHPGPVMDADKHAAKKLAKSVPSGAATQWNPKESRKQPGPAMDVDKSDLRSSVSTLKAQVVDQTSAGSNGGAGGSSVLSKGLQFDAPNATSQEPVVPHMQSVPSKLDVVNTGAVESKAASNDVSQRRNKRNKQKQSVYVETVASDKQKQRIQVESVVTDKPTPVSTSQTQKGHDVGATEIVTSQVDPMDVPSIPNNANIMQESVGHNRRKNNRSSRNKHKQDEAASSTASQSAGPPETHHTKSPASAAVQSAAPNEPHPSKNSAPVSTSQAPVPKESLPPKPSVTTALPSPGPKETHPTKTFAAAASQAPVQKETHQASAAASASASQLAVQKETPPAKASNTAFLPVQKETLPAKASATAALKSPVQKETLPAKVFNHAASQPLVWKETRPARASATATATATATSQPLVTKETLPAKASATVIATSQLPVQKETLPAKASPTTASQLPAQKETISAKASAAAAPQTPVQKETLPSKAPVTTASQRPVQKETLPSKASATATSQAQVKKETLPGKASGTAASQSLVHKETLPAKVAVTPLPKEIYAVKASAASQSSVPKETHSSKALPSVVSQSLVLNEAHRAIASVSASSQLPVAKGTPPVKAPLERGQPKASQLELDTNSVQLVSDVKDANQQPSSEQSPPLPSEEANSRVSNQWKPQNSRRMPRNPQALRSGDKFHSSESVVWAPVRSQNKLEPEGEGSEKAAHDATPATAKNDTPVQSSVKSKRAELERYVPKPVAKELAQQGSIQQPVALTSSTQTSDVTSEREGSGSQSVKPEVGNGRSSLEPRNGDFKQSKPTRTPGSWRQRGSSEAQHEKGIQQTSFSTSNPSKNVQKSMNQQDTSKPEFSFVPVENKVCHDWDPSDGWSMPEEPSANATVATVTHVVKDEGVGTGKGRRQPQKGHTNTVNSHDIDHMSSSGGEADKNHTHSAATDISQAERAVSSREGRGSQWQPKSQANLASNQRGSRYGGGQKDSFEVKKNSPPRGAQQDNKESSKITHQPTSEQYVSENKKVDEASNVRQEEARRERRPDSSRRRPRTPNQSVGPPDNMEEHAADQHYPSRRRPQTPNQSVGPPDNIEEHAADQHYPSRRPRTPNQSLGPPENMDEHAADQHYSSGFRRGGFQNNRGSGRGNESRRDWSSGGHDNRPQHVAPNRERQRQNAHFEYQPVGSSNNNGKFNNFDGEGSRNMGQRYRERGSGRPRRGGAGDFHGQQQSGSIRVEAGND